jgi:hypothetical protein
MTTSHVRRFARKYTWRERHDLYRLTAPAGIPNLQPSTTSVRPTKLIPSCSMMTSGKSWNTLGPRALLVEQAAQGLAALDLQCTCRDGDDETVFAGALQETPLPAPRLRVLRLSDTPSGKHPWYFTARDGSGLLLTGTPMMLLIRSGSTPALVRTFGIDVGCPWVARLPDTLAVDCGG